MGGTNEAATSPAPPTIVPQPAPGTAPELDDFATTATSAEQLAALLRDHQGTRSVQLLGKTYDLSAVANPPTGTVRVPFRMFAVGPAATIVGAAALTLSLQDTVKNVRFQTLTLDLDSTARLERVHTDAPVEATGNTLRLTMRDCKFNASADLGTGTYDILDCEFRSTLTLQPTSYANLKTNIHRDRLTILAPTVANARVFFHGGLFRLPENADGDVPMLDATANNCKMIISHCVFDLELVATPANDYDLVRLQTNADDQVFLNSLTFDPAPSTTVPVITSTGVGNVLLGVHNLKNAAQFDGPIQDMVYA